MLLPTAGTYACGAEFRGLRPEAGNAGSRGDLSHILVEVSETFLQFRSAHVRPPKPSPKA